MQNRKRSVAQRPGRVEFHKQSATNGLCVLFHGLRSLRYASLPVRAEFHKQATNGLCVLFHGSGRRATLRSRFALNSTNNQQPTAFACYSTDPVAALRFAPGSAFVLPLLLRCYGAR